MMSANGKDWQHIDAASLRPIRVAERQSDRRLGVKKRWQGDAATAPKHNRTVARLSILPAVNATQKLSAPLT